MTLEMLRNYKLIFSLGQIIIGNSSQDNCREELVDLLRSKRLGWVLSGPVSTPGHMNAPHSLMTHSLQVTLHVPEAQQPLEEIMKSFWELESFGIPATDRSLYDEFCDTARFHEGRYEVQLPWKTPRQELPNDYAWG